VRVLRSELIGCVPRAAVVEAAQYYLGLPPPEGTTHA